MNLHYEPSMKPLTTITFTNIIKFMDIFFPSEKKFESVVICRLAAVGNCGIILVHYWITSIKVKIYAVMCAISPVSFHIICHVLLVFSFFFQFSFGKEILIVDFISIKSETWHVHVDKRRIKAINSVKRTTDKPRIGEHMSTVVRTAQTIFKAHRFS